MEDFIALASVISCRRMFQENDARREAIIELIFIPSNSTPRSGLDPAWGPIKPYPRKTSDTVSRWNAEIYQNFEDILHTSMLHSIYNLA
jgi:hypothetical protein